MTGEIEKADDGVIVVRRIRVRYRLRVDAEPDEETRAKIDRAVERHPGKCPVARTIRDCVEIDASELEVVPA